MSPDSIVKRLNLKCTVYANENPEVGETDYACFNNKFYMNVLLDDKAGFDPELDWSAVIEAMITCKVNQIMSKVMQRV